MLCLRGVFRRVWFRILEEVWQANNSKGTSTFVSTNPLMLKEVQFVYIILFKIMKTYLIFVLFLRL